MSGLWSKRAHQGFIIWRVNIFLFFNVSCQNLVLEWAFLASQVFAVLSLKISHPIFWHLQGIFSWAQKFYLFCQGGQYPKYHWNNLECRKNNDKDHYFLNPGGGNSFVNTLWMFARAKGPITSKFWNSGDNNPFASPIWGPVGAYVSIGGRFY